MIWQMAGVPCRADHNYTGGRTFLDKLCKRIVQITLLLVTARRNVDYVDAEFLTIVEHPLQAFLDILLGYPSRTGQFNEHHIRIRSNAAIKPVRERTVTRGHDRRHHAMPTGDVRLEQRT